MSSGKGRPFCLGFNVSRLTRHWLAKLGGLSMEAHLFTVVTLADLMTYFIAYNTVFTVWTWLILSALYTYCQQFN